MAAFLDIFEKLVMLYKLLNLHAGGMVGVWFGVCEPVDFMKG